MTGGRRGLDWEPEIGDWDELEPEPEPGERLVRSGGQGLMMLVNTGASAGPGQGCRAQGVRSPEPETSHGQIFILCILRILSSFIF